MGTYENCLAARPVVNAIVTGFGSGVRVESARVKKAPGGRGILVVVSKKDAEQDPEGSEDPTQTPEDIVDWQRIDVPLANSDYFSSLTTEHWKQIKAWQAIETANGEMYGELKYPDSPGSTTGIVLSGLAYTYAEKIIKGITSVMVFVPVVTRATPNSGAPVTGTCGQRSSPPVSISGYTFLKTADRRNRRNRRWSRDEEWTGFKELDSDLYP